MKLYRASKDPKLDLDVIFAYWARRAGLAGRRPAH
jgi:hypothetical protein